MVECFTPLVCLTIVTRESPQYLAHALAFEAGFRITDVVFCQRRVVHDGVDIRRYVSYHSHAQ